MISSRLQAGVNYLFCSLCLETRRKSIKPDNVVVGWYKIPVTLLELAKHRVSGKPIKGKNRFSCGHTHEYRLQPTMQPMKVRKLK